MIEWYSISLKRDENGSENNGRVKSLCTGVYRTTGGNRASTSGDRARKHKKSSRNKKHFRVVEGKINVLTPEEFLAQEFQKG